MVAIFELEINFRNKWSIVNLNVSIRFLAYDNVGFASEIKSLCQINKILAEILKIFDFCGGHFEFLPIKKFLNDDRVSSIVFVISRVPPTRINNKTLYVL